jgi:hypothetical protein
MPFAPPSMKRASSANSRRICESLVLDSPKELLSKTPKQIAEAAAMLRKGVCAAAQQPTCCAGAMCAAAVGTCED